MCNKCIQKAISKEIVDVESKVTRIFKQVDSNPESLKHDESLISLMNCLSDIVEKYKEVK
jgi:hypothetical protein